MVRNQVNRRALAAIVLAPILVALALAFWPRPEPTHPGFMLLYSATRPTAEIRAIVKQLARDPQSVTAEGATTLGPDGYFSEIPRGSTVELTDRGWLVADRDSIATVLVRPQNDYAYETNVHLVLRDGRWQVMTVSQSLG